jgi:dsDNA-specific endonuclease/ATPase MutS2
VPSLVKLDHGGVLDLHHFAPREVPVLVDEFIYSCRTLRITEGKIIHGKGIGTLRNIVHSKLTTNPRVKSFWNGDGTNGGWGVTLFSLK